MAGADGPARGAWPSALGFAGRSAEAPHSMQLVSKAAPLSTAQHSTAQHSTAQRSAAQQCLTHSPSEPRATPEKALRSASATPPVACLLPGPLSPQTALLPASGGLAWLTAACTAWLAGWVPPGVAGGEGPEPPDGTGSAVTRLLVADAGQVAAPRSAASCRRRAVRQTQLYSKSRRRTMSLRCFPCTPAALANEPALH